MARSHYATNVAKLWTVERRGPSARGWIKTEWLMFYHEHIQKYVFCMAKQTFWAFIQILHWLPP